MNQDLHILCKFMNISQFSFYFKLKSYIFDTGLNIKMFKYNSIIEGILADTMQIHYIEILSLFLFLIIKLQSVLQ